MIIVAGLVAINIRSFVDNVIDNDEIVPSPTKHTQFKI